MAIVAPGVSECPHCRRKIESFDDYVAFPHFIRDREHPLWRYSDSAMHRACFVHWREAEEFRHLYNERAANSGIKREMRADGAIVAAAERGSQ